MGATAAAARLLFALARDGFGPKSFAHTSAKTGVPVNFAQRPLWLLKGSDRSGRNDFELGHRR